MANIKVTSKQDAWNKVNQLFPTDYEQHPCGLPRLSEHRRGPLL